MADPRAHVVRRGAGVPVVFVHGNGVDHRLLLDLDDAFERDGAWERIYLDLPGFGGTPPLNGRGGLPDVADWLDDVVGDLVGAESFAVVGNSLGGLLARDLVARRGDRCLGMALLAPVVESRRERRRLPGPRVLVEGTALLASLEPSDADVYREMSVVRTVENWERFRRAALPGILAADDDAMRRLAGLYELVPSRDRDVAGFPGPVLVLAGKQDAVVGYEDQWAMSRWFPRSTYAALDGAGHNLHIDRPGVVRAFLEEWSRSIAVEAGWGPGGASPRH